VHESPEKDEFSPLDPAPLHSAASKYIVSAYKRGIYASWHANCNSYSVHQPVDPVQIRRLRKQREREPMKLQMPKLSSFGCAAACSFAILTSLAAPAKADLWNKKTIVTIDGPLQVTDTVLQPGKYVFKLADSQANRHVVQIYNADESRLIDTILAMPNTRLQPTGESRFQMWETPAGHMQALRAWFYPGDNFGQEFKYPEHPKTLPSASTPTRPISLREENVEDKVTAQTPATTQPARPQVAYNPPPAQAASPAPAPQPAASRPAARPQREPSPEPTIASAELPHTATVYPAVGLFGLLALALFALLRIRRVA
jgi:hypothetical protein